MSVPDTAITPTTNYVASPTAHNANNVLFATLILLVTCWICFPANNRLGLKAVCVFVCTGGLFCFARSNPCPSAILVSCVIFVLIAREWLIDNNVSIVSIAAPYAEYIQSNIIYLSVECFGPHLLQTDGIVKIHIFPVNGGDIVACTFICFIFFGALRGSLHECYRILFSTQCDIRCRTCDTHSSNFITLKWAFYSV